jgi:hypothetical protein
VNFIEFVGFIAMLLLMLGSFGSSKRRKANPEEYDAQEKEKLKQLREFLQGVDGDFLETPKPLRLPQPPKPKTPSATHKLTTSQKVIPNAKVVTKVLPNNKMAKGKNDIHKGAYAPVMKEFLHTVEQDAYAPSKKDAYAFEKKKKSRAFGLLQQLRSPKDMVLWHEIIGPPKALRNEKFFGNFPR